METPPEPPPQYVAYPRAQIAPYGSAERLKALFDGYSYLNRIFILNVALAIASRALGETAGTPEIWLMIVAVQVLVMGLVIGFATYPGNKKIAFGAGWPPGLGVLASVLMGLNSALCCGIIGYVVMQQIAINHMKRYGLKTAFLGGIKRPQVELAVAQLRAQESQTTAPPAF